MKKRIFLIIVFLVLCSVIVLQSWGIIWTTEVLFKSCQPEDIDYHSWDPYCLVVVKRNRTLDKRMEIKIVSEPLIRGNDIGYGFGMNYFNDYYEERFDDEVRNAEVQWKPEGVHFSVPHDENNKYKLFIPKQAFIGGR